ncbi:MAG: PD40 domain-containing protein, partial [Fidelibacterota bacterium]
TNNPEFYGYPKFSPDGSRIVFQAHIEGSYSFYIMDADGSNPTRLSEVGSSLDNAYIQFSPDGSRLYYEDSGAIMSMDISGDNIETLAEEGRFPSLSPDGLKIVYCDGGVDPFFKTRNVFIMNSDGSDKIQLTDFQPD